MLDGMSKIPDLVAKARRDGMYAMALTDHGNMFGIKDFLDTVAKVNKNRAEGEPEFKPIVGTTKKECLWKLTCTDGILQCLRDMLLADDGCKSCRAIFTC